MKKSPRAKEIQRHKAENAMFELDDLGFEPTMENDGEIQFYFKGELVKYFPLKEWFTGKSVEDGRGFKNLIKQLNS